MEIFGSSVLECTEPEEVGGWVEERGAGERDLGRAGRPLCRAGRARGSRRAPGRTRNPSARFLPHRARFEEGGRVAVWLGAGC